MIVGREAFVLRLISDSSESRGAASAAGVPAADDALLDAYSRTIIDVAEHAGPAVVGIRRHGRDHDPDNPFAPVLGSGSGVIITPDGYVLTNDHVVRGAPRLEAVLSDGTGIEARVVGEDPDTDLALLRHGQDRVFDRFRLRPLRRDHAVHQRAGQSHANVGVAIVGVHRLGLGVLRHADAGYPEALAAAARGGLRMPMREERAC